MKMSFFSHSMQRFFFRWIMIGIIALTMASPQNARAFVPLKIDLHILDFFKAQCAKRTALVDNRIEHFTKHKEKRETAYETFNDRLTRLIEKMNAKGYDVADLRADQKVVEGKIEKFSDDYAAYLDQLAVVKEYACNHTDDEWKTEITKARTTLKMVRVDAKAIADYYEDVIKPDIEKVLQ
ncbi:MAG TPA: hypothetical protein VJL38_03595 [Patescibacteria group bacterium]|nr:hypothetical protein [Patescibacteria group bacterium]